MKFTSSNILRLAAIVLIAVTLSGCALSGRSRTTPTPEPSQAQSNQSTAPTKAPGDQQPTATATRPAPQAATPTKIGATSAPNNAQGDDLLKLIGTLDAANQAGDPLDDLP